MFTDFQEELEDLNINHPHEVRREQFTVYCDNFALEILNQESPRLYELELEGWARSYYSREAHMQSILSYNEIDTPYTAVNHRLYSDAVRAVQNELYSLPMTRAFDVLTELDKVKYEQSSSAGYNYRGPKGPIGGENYERAIRLAKATLWSALRDEDGGPTYIIKNSVPDVGYTRTQLTNLKEKLKVRGVWGRAFHYILLEGTAARPVLENFITSRTFFHIGDDPQLSVPRLLSDVSHKCKWLYALDWSGFDTTVSRFEIEHAFRLLKERINFPNFETEQTFEISRLLFTHKKIAAPDGRTFWSHRGIPSGSYYTSIIGSIINRLRVEYIWRKIKGRGPKMCFTQGDDSLIGDDELIDPQVIADAAQPYNWKINSSKTEYSTTPELVSFLGRTTYGGLNKRELDRCLRLLIFPEYPVESGRISAFRAASIAEDSGGMSEIINTIARRLRRNYGIANYDEVPKYFKVYVP